MAVAVLLRQPEPQAVSSSTFARAGVSGEFRPKELMRMRAVLVSGVVAYP